MTGFILVTTLLISQASSFGGGCSWGGGSFNFGWGAEVQEAIDKAKEAKRVRDEEVAKERRIVEKKVRVMVRTLNNEKHLAPMEFQGIIGVDDETEEDFQVTVEAHKRIVENTVYITERYGPEFVKGAVIVAAGLGIGGGLGIPVTRTAAAIAAGAGGAERVLEKIWDDTTDALSDDLSKSEEKVRNDYNIDPNVSIRDIIRQEVEAALKERDRQEAARQKAEAEERAKTTSNKHEHKDRGDTIGRTRIGEGGFPSRREPSERQKLSGKSGPILCAQ